MGGTRRARGKERERFLLPISLFPLSGPKSFSGSSSSFISHLGLLFHFWVSKFSFCCVSYSSFRFDGGLGVITIQEEINLGRFKVGGRPLITITLLNRAKTKTKTKSTLLNGSED